MLNPGEQKSFAERFSLVRTLEKDCLAGEKDALEMTLQDADTGDFFACSGQTFFVRKHSTYQETSEDHSRMLEYQVHELSCLCLETGETVYFEWEYDDELEITRTMERISFRELTDDAGESIDAGDLDQIVEDEDVILYQGKKFWYEDDWAAIYQCNGKKEPVYFYEFQQEGAALFLTIEHWSDSSSHEQSRKDYQIFISQPVASGEITMISKGANHT